jgi:hypothetical protein
MTAARAPQRGGLSLSGGSPTGYRRSAREIPNRVIAMRESNAPSPPVSQSAAITSSRRNNLLLRTPQTVECATHVVYPLASGEFHRVVDAGRPRPHDQTGTKPRRRQRWGVERAGQRTRNPSRTTMADTSSCDGMSPLTKGYSTRTPGQCYPSSPWVLDRCAWQAARPLITAVLEWAPIKNHRGPGRALRLCLLAVT